MSTSTAMTQIVDTLYTATDSNLLSSLMALDQSSAFDCVSHPILIEQLKLYNCSQDTIAWMTEYLQHRSQQVTIGRHSSRISSQNRGVPQGSILGPLLYLIYTNELPEVTQDNNCNQPVHLDKSKLFRNNCQKCGLLVTFVDDCTLVISDRS